jgi:MFS family permease
MNEIYIAHSMDAFVMALFGIFVPIYLLTLDYSLSQVLVFFMIHAVASAVFFFLAGYISNKIGLKHTMLLRFPFIFAYIAMLYSLETVAIPLPLIVTIGAVGTSMHWMPILSLFVRHANKDHMGHSIGMLSGLLQLSYAFAPLIGGFIAVFFGFNVLFIVAMILSLLSFIPLFFTPEIKAHVKFKIEDGFKIYKENIKIFTALMIRQVRLISESVIWPIFVFLTLKSVMSVGIVGFLVFLSMSILTMIIGNLSDRKNKITFIRIGAIAAIILWTLRFFVQTPLTIYLITVLIGIFTIFISVPLGTILYKRAKDYNIDEYIILREVPIALGRVIILGIALLLVQKLELTFLVTAITQVFFLFF